MRYPWLVLLAIAALLWIAAQNRGASASEAEPLPPKELLFLPLRVDAPEHNPSKQTYWFGPFAECSSVLDINGDGKLDIAAGRNYYLAPTWQKLSDFRDGAETNGPDVDDNYEGTMDVNNDGRMDIISSGWMRRQGIWWYENPGKVGVKWNSQAIHPAEGLEGMVIGNLAGKDGKDLLVNYFAKRPDRSLVWLEHLDQAPWFREHKLGPEGVGVSHGNGIGDINGDGRNDVVTTSGWFEAPAHPATDPWKWHPDWEFAGGAGLPILVADVTGDGKNDVIIGSAHGYGLAWYEQKITGGQRKFVQHWIETEYPTFHTMLLADLDNDGRPELITGKQLFAHNGGDVGALEPVFLAYYKFANGRFERHFISYSHLEPLFRPGRPDTPPAFVVGTGMRLNAADMDGDGRQDIIVACRSGLYIFYNKGYSPKTRGINPLPDRYAYSSHREWESGRAQKRVDGEGYTILFDGSDLSAWQPASNWAVENGILVLKNRTDRQEHNDDYLWTQRAYGDFMLELDFKPVEGTNSGVFLRTSNPLDPVQTGIEVQIAGGIGSRLTRSSVGGLYDLVAPTTAPLKPHDWNHYRITCKGPKISVELNGTLVSEADLDRWKEPRKNPDGSANKFTVALKDFARAGYLGLQNHGTPVSYRNIRIREIVQ